MLPSKVRSAIHDTSKLDQFTGAVSANLLCTSKICWKICFHGVLLAPRTPGLPTSPFRLTFSAPACPPSRLNSFSACQDIERAVRPRRSKGHSSDTSKSNQRRADLMGHSAGPTWCAAMPEPRLSSCTIGCAELQVLYCGSLSLMLHSISCFDVMDLVRCGMLTYS